LHFLRISKDETEGYHPMKLVWTYLIIIWMTTGETMATPIHFQTEAQRVPLLELYTSEGCSSCPPAESWLNRLKDSPVLWRNFVPVSFHVDYWNSPSWKDRWSRSEYSDRQRVYAQVWNADTVYTPCFVLNGKEWFSWRFRQSVPNTTGTSAGVLTVGSTDSRLWTATFVPTERSDADYEIHAALLAGDLGSDVKGGENHGRYLNHEFVALNLIQTRMTTRQGVAGVRFILDTSRYGTEEVRAIAVWVTRSAGFEPLQATGGWLHLPGSAK
jgi:hypothetical protein